MRFRVRKRFSLKKTYIDIPCSWEDITVVQFLRMRNAKSNIELCESISGLTIENFGQVAPYLDFTKTELDFSQIEKSNFLKIDGEFIPVPNIRECTFGQKILFSSKLKTFDIANISEIVAVYMTEKFSMENMEVVKNKIDQLPIFEVYAVYLNLIDQFKVTQENEKKAFATAIDMVAIQAGSEKFNQFGDFNTVDKLAKEYNYTHEEVECLSYELVFLILHKANVSNIFEKNYRTIKKATK